MLDRFLGVLAREIGPSARSRIAINGGRLNWTSLLSDAEVLGSLAFGSGSGCLQHPLR
jgi:hypothetical protein